MVQNSITIKAETVEEAIQTALNILQCSVEEINVQVVKPSSNSLFGFRKRLAEVSITRRVSVTGSQNKNNDKENSIFTISDEELDGLIEKVYDSTMSEVKRAEEIISNHPKNAFITQSNELTFGAWISGNKVHIQENEQKLPIIEAGKNATVLVNGKKLVKPQLVTSQDKVIIELEDEVVPSSFWIEIKDNNMMATLSIKPGQKIERSLEETDPQEHLIIQVKETVTSFIDITLEDIAQRLKGLQIEHGIMYSSIHDMLKSGDGETIIAKGISPIEGLDGDIEVLIDGWEESKVENMDRNQFEKVDFREGQSILAVEVGQIIAQRIVAIPGRPGKDLFERVVHPKPVYEVAMKLGKHVEKKDNYIVALSAGRPHIESRGKLIKIDVIKEHVHTGDVSLESGNIRFSGDVRVMGNVLDSMIVEAEGRIYIAGTVNRAVVQSGQSMEIKKNVFSSELSVGKVNHVIASLTQHLSELLTYLDHILGAIKQILMVHQEIMKISYLLRLLLEKKYGDFEGLVTKFCMIVGQNEKDLDEEWTTLSIKLKKHFITVSLEQNLQLQTLESLVDRMREMYETYFSPPEPNATIELPYGINSTLYSSGNINVLGQGVYHCNLKADHNVTINGVCRGGSVTAGNEVFLDEVGSENGGKTTILVPPHGKIFINFAHIDTVIRIGSRMHSFKQGTANITASLDADGNLQLYKQSI